jgi:penicillin-binding protein-related factor A (putative recombinase)
MKKPTSRKLVSAASGARAEELLDVYHQACELAGIATMRRVGTPLRVVGKPGAGAQVGAAFTKKSTVDYLGWTSTGRVIAIEVKSIQLAADDRQVFPLANLKEHQRQELERVLVAGGIAVVAIFVNGQLYVLPWAEVRLLIAARATVLPVEALKPWRARVPLYMEHLV